MRKTKVGLIIVFLCLVIYSIRNMEPKANTVDTVHQKEAVSLLPFSKGEEFEYEVRYKNVKVGTSTLTFQGEEELDNKKVYHITFFTRVAAVTDKEELYADTKTFLPVEVHRTIKRFGTFTTKIKEKYNQEKFRVDIRKWTKFRSEEFSIEKRSPLHNAILLSYYYRTKGDYDNNKGYKINLPTVDFEVMYKGKETIETPLGDFVAFAFTSEPPPPKFKLWLSSDERRLPLRIENPSKLDYSLIIKSID